MYIETNYRESDENKALSNTNNSNNNNKEVSPVGLS